MAHVAEHIIGFYGRINTGVATYFVGSIDSDAVLSSLGRVRPTVFGAVPRIFEKAYGKIKATVARMNRFRRAFFAWSERQGRAISKLRQAHQKIPWGLRVRHLLADLLIFRRLRKVFGGRVEYFICGGAPIDADILEFFDGAGMLVVEAYGLTECSAVCCINRPDDYRLGTVGRPLPGVEVAIADDGEILTRGPNVFKGYFNRPDATRAALDEDDWLHTGDIGELQEGRWLRVTDRKKNLIVTSGGKNVAPAALESLLSTELVMGPVLIVGDGRNYLTALVTLDADGVREVTGKAHTSIADLRSDRLIVCRVHRAIVAANTELARYERIRRYKILPAELTIAAGELTPTLKVRRKTVSEKYRSDIDALYQTPLVDDVIEVED